MTAPVATERMEPIELDELERLLSEDAVEVIDVREKNERDEGYIPGSRNIPYRLVGSYADELSNGKPSSRSARAAPAPGSPRASSPLAASKRGRSSTAASPDWQARGNTVTSFRRCGSG